MPERDLLFIYGTLLAVAEHPMGDLLCANGRLIGRGTIRARLYLIDDPVRPGAGNIFPGAVWSHDQADRVHGELHEVHDARVYEAFDRFEACAPGDEEPYEFLRRRVPVRMEDGAEVWARTYLYTWDVTGAEYVPSGRYTSVSPDVL